METHCQNPPKFFYGRVPAEIVKKLYNIIYNIWFLLRLYFKQ